MFLSHFLEKSDGSLVDKRGHQRKAAPKPNGNDKSGNGAEHLTEAFPIGHTGELAETQPKAMSMSVYS